MRVTNIFTKIICPKFLFLIGEGYKLIEDDKLLLRKVFKNLYFKEKLARLSSSRDPRILTDRHGYINSAFHA